MSEVTTLNNIKKPRWSVEDLRKLEDLYPSTTAKQLTAVFPGRSKSSIKQAAKTLGIIKRDFSKYINLREIIWKLGQAGKTNKEIANLLSISTRTVSKHFNALKFHPRLERPFWTLEEEKLLETMFPAFPTKEVQKFLPGRSKDAINHRAMKLKLSKAESCRKSFPEKLLEQSPEAYYWVGFLLGDGSIDVKTFAASVNIGILDKVHLESFARFLGISKVRVRKGVPYCIEGRKGFGADTVVITFRHEIFVKKVVEKFDFKQKKTYHPPDIEIYKEFDTKLLHCLFIGYIDAEGSLVEQPHRKGVYNIAISVHKSWISFLDFLAEDLATSVGAVTPRARVLSYRDPMCSVNIGKAGIIKYLKNLIEENQLPVLDRKWGKIR